MRQGSLTSFSFFSTWKYDFLNLPQGHADKKKKTHLQHSTYALSTTQTMKYYLKI